MYLAFSEGRKDTPERVIAHAIIRYQERFGKTPTECRVNPKTASRISETFPLTIIADARVPDKTYYLGAPEEGGRP
jgi:hypothetical protein